MGYTEQKDMQRLPGLLERWVIATSPKTALAQDGQQLCGEKERVFCTEPAAMKFPCGRVLLPTTESGVCDPYFCLVCVKTQLWSIHLNYRSL